MGKARLRIMLAREGTLLSESTIGRILEKGIALGHVRPCAFLRGRAKPKKRRNFAHGHAKRLPSGMRSSTPGQLVCIDHMSISRDGKTSKEFRAVCPSTKIMFCRVFTCATAYNARLSVSYPVNEHNHEHIVANVLQSASTMSVGAIKEGSSRFDGKGLIGALVLPDVAMQRYPRR